MRNFNGFEDAGSRSGDPSKTQYLNGFEDAGFRSGDPTWTTGYDWYALTLFLKAAVKNLHGKKIMCRTV